MKILLVGEGGQGVQMAAKILSYAAFLENRSTSLIPNFGVEQRGGVSLAFVKIEEGNYPKFEKADILAIFCDRAIERAKRYIDSQTKIICGPQVSRDMTNEKWLTVNDKGLPAKVWNIIILGKIIEESGVVDKESVGQALEEILAKTFRENPQLKKINFKALE